MASRSAVMPCLETAPRIQYQKTHGLAHGGGSLNLASSESAGTVDPTGLISWIGLEVARAMALPWLPAAQ